MATFKVGDRVVIDEKMYNGTFSRLNAPYTKKMFTVTEVIKNDYGGMPDYKLDKPAMDIDDCIWPEMWLISASKLTLIRKERIK